MNNLNSLIIEGNVVREPDFREPSAGFKVCIFTVAVNRWYKTKKGTGEEEVSYFDVETYGKMAEVCSEKLKKGGGVRVVGRLKQDRWEDSGTGKKKSSVYVIGEHVEFKPVYSTNKTDSKAVEKPAEKAEEVVEEKEVVTVPQTEEVKF